MKALITGANGFVGKNLIPYLNQAGLFTIAASRISEYTVESFFDPVLIDELAINSIVHLAGKAHDIKGVSDPEEYYRINTDLTKKIFDAFLMSSAESFIFMSSVKAVADTADSPLDESAFVNPITPYGDSKRKAEEYLLSKKIPTGKRVFILRPCMIHGPGNKGNLNLLYKFVKHGIPYPLAKFDNQRSFLSVENLCFVITKIIQQRNITDGIYHMADNESLSTKELIRIIANEIGQKPKFWHLPVGFVKFVARVGNLFKLPLNSSSLDKLTENYIVDNKKIRLALKQELPVSAVEGLRKTIASFEHVN
jgi:nucleoside-diphosphate-sugar epimerase